MDLKQKIKRERDEYQDRLAWAHTRHPDAADPVEEIFRELEAAGVYGETEREEAADLQWEYASVHERINSDKIDPEEARRMLNALDVRAREIKMRLAERMADILGVDVKELVPDEDDEK
jgi:chromosome segregation ATPase